MKFFRKMDEMEKDITLKSEKIALVFTKLCLAAWSVYIFVSGGFDPVKLIKSWAWLLLILMCLVQYWSGRVMQIRLSKGGKDEE